MNTSIVLIVCYMGPLPSYFDLWKRSCEAQSTIDFILVTDQPLSLSSDNLRVVKMTLRELSIRSSQILGLDIDLKSPYKICDLRPAFGLIFENLVSSYSFWGHCDLDQIFGSLRTFLTDDVLSNHDKIYESGHLTLYRNNEECNHRFMLPGQEDWREVFADPKSYAFDEYEMARKYRKHGFPVYLSNDAADIASGLKRYTLTNFSIHGDLAPRPNYDLQIFYWENGHVLRAYADQDGVRLDEFSYIHLQKRQLSPPECDPQEAESFFISDNRFIGKPVGIPTVDDIRRLNPYRGRFLERAAGAIDTIQTSLRRRRRKLARIVRGN